MNNAKLNESVNSKLPHQNYLYPIVNQFVSLLVVILIQIPYIGHMKPWEHLLLAHPILLLLSTDDSDSFVTILSESISSLQKKTNFLCESPCEGFGFQALQWWIHMSAATTLPSGPKNYFNEILL